MDLRTTPPTTAIAGLLDLDTEPYSPKYARQAEKLAARGFDLAGIADVLEVDVGTLTVWRGEYPDMARALAVGVTCADADVAAALHRRAVGYDVTETRVIGEQVIERSRHITPDIRACIFWLQRRRPREWCPRAVSRPTVSAS